MRAVACAALALATLPQLALAQGPSAAGYAEPGANVLPLSAPSAGSGTLVVPSAGSGTVVVPPAANVGGGQISPTAAPSVGSGDAVDDTPRVVRARPATAAGGPTLVSQTAPVGANDGDTLPFTGADAVLAAIAGWVLLSVGLVLRRSTRGPD